TAPPPRASPPRSAALPAAATYALALAATVLCALWVFDQPRMVSLALNSDTLLPFSFAWDLAHMPGAWRGHELARIPSLVPDLAALAAIGAATGAVRPTVLLYGIAQALAFVHVAAFLAARLAGPDAAPRRFPRFAAACALMSAALAALVALEGASATGVVLNAFLPIDHFGPFLAAPLAGWLAAAQLRRTTARRALALAACCSLAFLSDLLLLAEMVLPLLCACAVLVLARRTPPRRAAGIAAAAAAGTFAGWLGFRALRMSGLRFESAPRLSPALVRASIGDFLAHAPAYAAAHPAALAAGLLLPLAAFAAFPWLAFAQARRDPRARFSQDLFLWLFAGAGMAGGLAFTMLLYVDEASYRYLVALWAWPPVFLAATLLRTAPPALAAAAAALAACALAVPAGQGGWPPAVLRWDQDVAACLRPLHASLGLHAGLAGYWDARAIQAATGWTMQVDQLDGDGHPYLWGNDRGWYTHALADPSRPPDYDFIVMRDLPPARILAAYGPPDSVAPCPPTEIWIYRNPAALAQRKQG
ncbi:MAG: hypothetical protein ACRYG6_09990, partial [Janthinobacterium lividum]